MNIVAHCILVEVRKNVNAWLYPLYTYARRHTAACFPRDGEVGSSRDDDDRDTDKDNLVCFQKESRSGSGFW